MNTKNFIKVTINGQIPVVVLSSNEAFYRSQGAKVEEPTENEIIEFFPEFSKSEKPKNTADQKDLKSKLVLAEKTITDLQAENKNQKTENEALQAEIEILKADLDAANAKIAELEVKQ